MDRLQQAIQAVLSGVSRSHLDVLLFLVVATTFWGRSSTASHLSSMYWVDSATGKIQRSALDGSNVVDVVVGLNSPQALEIDVNQARVYWKDGSDIWTANDDGTGAQVLVGGAGAKDIALDLVNAKLYWTAATIRRANLDGSGAEDVVAGLTNPWAIAVDPPRGKVYWSDGNDDKLQRANLDGTNVQDLITTNVPFAAHIALDTASSKLYWGDIQDGAIRRINTFGGGYQELVSGLMFPAGITIDEANNKMYWTDYGTSKIQRATVDGTDIEDLVVGGINSPWDVVVNATTTAPYCVLTDNGDGTATLVCDHSSFTLRSGDLFNIATLPAGDPNCPHGGYRWDTGRDNGDGGGAPADGVLQPGEVDASSFVCNGAPGTPGQNAPISLLSLVSLPAGDPACPDGGTQINAGLDDGDGAGVPGDGVLQPDEIDSVALVCNGATGGPGANGHSALVAVRDLPPGVSCPQGGFELSFGVDDGSGAGVSGDGTLDMDEVLATVILCHGVGGAAASSCTVASAENGTTILTCPDGTSVKIRDGKDGGCASTPPSLIPWLLPVGVFGRQQRRAWRRARHATSPVKAARGAGPGPRAPADAARALSGEFGGQRLQARCELMQFESPNPLFPLAEWLSERLWLFSKRRSHGCQRSISPEHASQAGGILHSTRPHRQTPCLSSYQHSGELALADRHC